jgi:hypothetical protein
MLKAADAVIYRSARALGFQPVLYLYHQVNGDLPEGWTRRIFATCQDLALGQWDRRVQTFGVVQGFAAFLRKDSRKWSGSRR